MKAKRPKAVRGSDERRRTPRQPARGTQRRSPEAPPANGDVRAPQAKPRR